MHSAEQALVSLSYRCLSTWKLCTIPVYLWVCVFGCYLRQRNLVSGGMSNLWLSHIICFLDIILVSIPLILISLSSSVDMSLDAFCIRLCACALSIYVHLNFSSFLQIHGDNYRNKWSWSCSLAELALAFCKGRSWSKYLSVFFHGPFYLCFIPLFTCILLKFYMHPFSWPVLLLLYI